MFLFLITISSVDAQKYDFKVYSVNDGLPQGQVNDIYQTSDGFIWFATNGGGLSRFDGKNFKTYTTRDGLRNNAVQKILEDSDGNLWVSNYPGGVVTFKGDSFVNPFPEDSLSNFEVWQIKEFSNGEIWFGTYEGGIFILKDGDLSRLTVEDGLISNSIWDFKEDKDGRIWVATQEGISVINTDSTITNYTTEDGLSGEKVYRFAENHQGEMWFGTSDGITVWDGENFRAIKEINGISLGYVLDVEADSDGRIWIGTESKGVFVYDGEEYTHFTRKNGLSSNYIFTFYEDKDDNMWIGTNENGASLYRGSAFLFYDRDFGLSTNEVLNVLMDSRGTLWMGTMEGIQSFDGDKIKKHPLPGEYENKYIWEIEELSNGNVVFVMPDNTLMEYDGEQFHNFTSKKGLKKWFIYDLFVDSNEVLWIATDEGLFRLKEGELNQFTKEDGMAGNVVLSVQEGNNGLLFIGTYEGLSIYDGDTFKNISISDGLVNNGINYTVQDEEDNIWVGTDGGVSVLQPNENNESYSISNFGKEEGMDLLATHFLWFDEEGYLWQGTNGGLNRLDVPRYWETGEMNLVQYALSDYGMGVEFNFKAITEDKENNAWFGSMDGVLKLDVSKLQQQKSKDLPTVHIINIKRNSESINWANYTTDLNYKTGSLDFPYVEFPYGEHSYTFTFVGLDYLYPRNVQYRYKMEGFDDEWMPVTAVNNAIYTNLEPGNYTFVVQAISSGQDLNPNTATYSFSVAYPFWQTYWFYGLVFISMAGLIYGYIKIRLGMLEKNRLQKLVNEQTKDLQEALAEKEVLIKEIHHRVKNNLAVISGLIELQMGYTDNEFASRILSESQRRVRSIAMIHEKLYQNERLAEIDFERYIRELVDIINYSFSHIEKDIAVDTEIEDISLGIVQAIPCGLILNELVSNCFEHAFKGRSKGSIKVSLQVEDEEAKLQVSDNGVGMPDDIELKETDSLGLTLIETLVSQLQGDLDIDSSKEGTKFTITFEIKEAMKQIPVD
ncbi:MAG: two-component regulator propeller domain-containing protein [Balneolaceae bacterium]|nr:two-component regulator propeller domain-containing protein [Balneolaceae bacterium]